MSEKKKYCGVGDIPKGSKRGSMRDCAEAKQIRYYGVKQADSKMIQYIKNSGTNKKDYMKIVEKRGTLAGQYTVLAKKHKLEKNPDKQLAISDQYRSLVQEWKVLGAKLAVMDGKAPKVPALKEPVKVAKKSIKNDDDKIIAELQKREVGKDSKGSETEYAKALKLASLIELSLVKFKKDTKKVKPRKFNNREAELTEKLRITDLEFNRLKKLSEDVVSKAEEASKAIKLANDKRWDAMFPTQKQKQPIKDKAMSNTIKLLLETHKQQTEINEKDLNKVVHANATNDEMEKLRKLNELLNEPPSRNSLHEISEFLLTEDEVASGVDYVGSTISEWSWLMYIQDYIGLDVCTYVPRGITLDYEPNTQELKVNARFVRDIIQCLENEPSFIIGTLAINFPLMNSAHSNGLIFNVKERSVVRFEPQVDEYAGSTFRNVQSFLDEMMSKLLEQIYEGNNEFGKWTYIKPTDICPNIGPQTRELLVKYNREIDKAGGFCQAWSSFYMLLRVTNPDKTDKQIVKDLLKNDNKTLSSMIRRFAGFVQTLVDDNNENREMIENDVYNRETFDIPYSISKTQESNDWMT